MEGCLLCFELKKELVDSIAVTSYQWDELNLKSIIGKYLWPMNNIEANSWICSNCWKELYDFHKFYLYIENIHKNFELFQKNGTEVKQNFNNEIAVNEIAEYPQNVLNEIAVEEIGKSPLYVNHLKNDIVSEENKPILLLESAADNNLLVQKRKRGRPRQHVCSVNAINKDDVNKTIKYEKYKVSRSIEKPKRSNQNKSSKIHSKYIEINNEIVRSTLRNSDIKFEPPASVEQELSFDNDNDSSDEIEIKSSYNTDCQEKNNWKEKDKFIADNFKITCFLCNIPFETFFSMLKHFEVKHPTEVGHVKCCNKKFYRRSILVDHVHYHLNPNYFKCNQCGKVMASRRCLDLHVRIHETNHEKNHSCDICGKGFAKLGVLNKHRMIHLSEEEKRFSCTDCGKNFALNSLLSNHYRTVHLRKYIKICDICGKAIRCKDVFERHMLQHEGKTAPSVSCDICGLILTDKKALKRHKSIIHPVGGQHAYTCSICSKISPNLRAHQMHVQYKHVKGYDHKCTICDKAFKRAPTLKEHMASHTGTVLYTCPWCPKTFNSNANMHSHRKKMHPKEWEEASRKKYSGNVPPNFKPPKIAGTSDLIAPLDIN